MTTVIHQPISSALDFGKLCILVYHTQNPGFFGLSTATKLSATSNAFSTASVLESICTSLLALAQKSLLDRLDLSLRLAEISGALLHPAAGSRPSDAAGLPRRASQMTRKASTTRSITK